MKSAFKTWVDIALACFLTVGGISLAEVPSLAEKSDPGGLEVRSLVYDFTEVHEAVITFERGSANLSEREKSDLAAWLRSVPRNTSEMKLVLAGWSDLEYPLSPSIELTTDAANLANQRVATVTDFLRMQGGYLHIQTFNLGKHASALGRIFRTDDAQLKDQMQGKAPENSEIDAIATTLKRRGGPSRVVALMYGRNTAVSH